MSGRRPAWGGMPAAGLLALAACAPAPLKTPPAPALEPPPQTLVTAPAETGLAPQAAAPAAPAPPPVQAIPAPAPAGTPLPANIPLCACLPPQRHHRHWLKPPLPPPPPPPAPSSPPVNPEPSMSLLGRKVVDTQGEEVGRLVDVLVDEGGTARAAVIDVGGFLGVGNRKVAVSWDKLRFKPHDPDHLLQLGIDREQVQAAPEFKGLPADQGSGHGSK